MSKSTISTLPALSTIRTVPVSGTLETLFSGKSRPFPGKLEIQGALAYPLDQFCRESKKSRFWPHVPEWPVFGQNPAEPDSSSSLITVVAGSGFSRKVSLFRVPRVLQKVKKYSPLCSAEDPAFPGFRDPDPWKPRVDLGKP